MKKIALIIALLISSLSFADAGYAYRFHLNLQSEKGEITDGYFYFILKKNSVLIIRTVSKIIMKV